MSALDQVALWPGEAAAAAVVTATGRIADAGAIRHRHEWASVTKLVTAYRILALADDGVLALDEPAGPPDSTVAHLLAHASGLGFDDDAVLAAPGRRRIYSNTGFEQLAALAVERDGRPFAEQLRATVFAPLGMDGTELAGPASSGVVGPLVDLAHFCRELMAPTIVTAQTLQQATTVVFPGLDGVLPGFGRQVPNDWGLGFEVRDGKDPHWTGASNSPATYGHFGRSGSFLWVDPSVGIGCVALTGVAFGSWAAGAWPVFADAVLAEYAPR